MAAAAAAADWNWKEERSAMEDGDIEDCLLGGNEDDKAEAEAGGGFAALPAVAAELLVRACLTLSSISSHLRPGDRMSRIAGGSARASKTIE